jgi:hypothetical protein
LCVMALRLAVTIRVHADRAKNISNATVLYLS